MDPFTQRILERTKMRREKLDQHFSRHLDTEPRQPLQEKSIQNTNIKEFNQIDGNNTANSRTKLSKSKEAGNAENRFSLPDDQYENDNDSITYNKDKATEKKVKAHKFGRLAELAIRIKEWEDEVDKPKSVKTIVDTVPSVSEKGMQNIKLGHEKKQKPVFWDKSIIESLESQGYSLSQNESRLIYDFRQDDTTQELAKTEQASTKCSSQKQCTTLSKQETSGPKSFGRKSKVTESCKDSTVLKKAAFFECHNLSGTVKLEKDPAELSISERKAIFEKNSGEALIPKVAFGTPLPAKLIGCATKSISDQRKQKTVLNTINSEKREEIGNLKKIIQKFEDPSAPAKMDITISEFDNRENKVNGRNDMFESGRIYDKNISSTDKGETNIPGEESECLKSHQVRNPNLEEHICSAITIPHQMPSPRTESSEECVEKVEDKKETAKLYPSLSEFEESECSDGSDEPENTLSKSHSSSIYLNMSFSDILSAKNSEPLSSNDNSFNTELHESQVLSKMDEFLDNALNELSSTDDDDGNSDAPSPPKMLKSSSFVFKRNNESTKANSLLHTVSFYRKQQNNSNQTPDSVKSVKREETVCENITINEDVLVENKIEELLQEINKQQTIISQASQALNLCLSTVEFSGSGEQVESERLLLLANHKRQACLNEIHRLKIEKTIRPQGCTQQLTEKGDVIITDICIPLKREALRAMAAAESMQYLVCLIKSDERVIATPAIPAARDHLRNMVLYIPGQYKLENLLSDFKVTIEIYNLELNKEMLPHEVKYHINNKKDKKLLTPIKSKKVDSKLIVPQIQSPAGPNAVRSSNFHLCGYVLFSLREVNRTQWTLSKVPYTSPLDGSFSMKIQSQLQLDSEFKGFLTMFDDISGFGAWHRRWCLLSSYTLSYWKYPDDETRKVPIGTIDLRAVVTENVGLVSRDICARLHTFLLETTRQKLDDDKESLVLNVQGDITKIRHLLSADSKEEMLQWCQKLNTTLALLRSWRCNFVP